MFEPLNLAKYRAIYSPHLAQRTGKYADLATEFGVEATTTAEKPAPIASEPQNETSRASHDARPASKVVFCQGDLSQ
jgi:hypothetical protein